MKRAKPAQLFATADNERAVQNDIKREATRRGHGPIGHAQKVCVDGRWFTPMARGFPDLVIPCPSIETLVIVEVKLTRKHPLDPDQTKWVKALQACTQVETWVIAQEDLPALYQVFDGN